MKITLITSERLSEFPPIITLLEILDQQHHQVVFLTPYQDPTFDELNLKSVIHMSASHYEPQWLMRYYSDHLRASAAFHTARFMRGKHLNRILKKFSDELQTSDIVWILHENTVHLGGKRFVKKLNTFLYTMYELCIKNGKTPKIYDYAACQAALAVVPEYCRSHIAKAYYALEQLPAVIPNKPLKHPRKRLLTIDDNEITKKIDEIKKKNKKIIMYMGILSNERPLEPIIEAVHNSSEYELVVLGARTPYLERLEKTKAGKFVYLGVVNPPHHLEVASHADVAYISYVPNNHSINAVFCAPNKVYEFAGFGIPMLCNDNPGLKFTVEYKGMGVCVSELTTDVITEALKYIDNHYADMSQAAMRYYDEESVEKAVERTLERYQTLIKGKTS